MPYASYKEAKAKTIPLLTPAFSSFGEERGNCFERQGILNQNFVRG